MKPFLPTATIYTRVFQVLIGDNTATCFTIEHGGTQYLLTAGHVVQGVDLDDFRIVQNGVPTNPSVSLVGVSDEPTDLAVLRPAADVAQRLPLSIGVKGLAHGQDVLFLGYPYGRQGATAPGLANVPFVKKGIVSNIVTLDGETTIYLDALNNPGFSGGPVVALNQSGSIQVVAVVSGYVPEFHPVKKGKGSYHFNSGLVVSYPIDFAVRLIDETP